MPALFSTPKVEKVEQTPAIEPAELKAETAKVDAEKERERLKAARKVQTILAGGAEDLKQKEIDGQSILLGSGKPLRKN